MRCPRAGRTRLEAAAALARSQELPYRARLQRQPGATSEPALWPHLERAEIVTAPVQDHPRAGGWTHDLVTEVRLALFQAELAPARGSARRRQSGQKLTRCSDRADATARPARRPCRSSAAG